MGTWEGNVVDVVDVVKCILSLQRVMSLMRIPWEMQHCHSPEKKYNLVHFDMDFIDFGHHKLVFKHPNNHMSPVFCSELAVR